MKLRYVVVILMPLGLAACEGMENGSLNPEIQSTARQQESADTWYMDTVMKGDATAGIISQRTLYPYHFDPGAARLTELGRRDLAILADYYKITPGTTLTVVKGDASNDLYAARTTAVRDALQQAGVDVAKVTIADGYSGGRGISGQRIVDDLAHDTGQFNDTGMEGGKQGTPTVNMNVNQSGGGQ